MKPLRYRWVVLTAAVALAAGGVITALWPDARSVGFILPWPSLALSLLLAAVCLVLAWRVRAHVKDPRGKRIEPIFAARIAVLAQTCAVYGAILFGWACGVMLYEGALLRFRPASETLALSMVNAAVGIAVSIAGCVAEAWCKRPPDDPEDPAGHRGDGRRRDRPTDLPEGEGGYARFGSTAVRETGAPRRGQ